MKDQNKTKARLIAELEEARERISELEQAEAEWVQTEKTLRTSEGNYRQIVELSPNGIGTFNLKGIVLSINRAFTEITGFEEDEMVGKHVLNVPTKPKILSSTLAQLMSNIIKEKKVGTVEFEWQHKNGETRNGEARLGVIKKGEKVVGVQAVLTDITERVRAEEALRASEERYRELFEMVPVCLWEEDFSKLKNYLDKLHSSGVTDLQAYFQEHPEGLVHCANLVEITDVNETAVQLAGVESKEQLLGNLSEQFIDESYNSFKKEIIELYERGGVFQGENISKSPQGNKIYSEINGKIATGHEDTWGKYLVSQVDITKRVRSEEALRESEKLLRTIADNYPNSFLSIIEKDFTIGFTSGQEFKKLNLDPEQFIGLTLEQVFGDQAPIVREHYEKTFDGEERSFELLINNQHQHYRTVPLYAEDNSIPRILAVAENITERKQVELELKESEERFRTIFNAEPECVKTLNPDTTLVTMNPAGLAMIEVESLDMVKGQSVLPIIDEEFRDDFRRLTDNVCQKGQSGMLEFRITGLKGTPRWLETHAVPLRNSNGEIAGLLGVTRDITERVQAQAELKKLGAAVQQSPACVVITNLEGNIEYVNPKFTDLTGYSTEEVLGKNPRILQSGEMSKEAYTQLWQTILSGKDWRGEFHNKKKNGELYWEDASISPIVNNNGDITHFLAVKENITERKESEQALREREAKLQSIFRAAPIGIGMTIDRVIQEANRMLCQLTGYPREELVGQSARMLYPSIEEYEYVGDAKYRMIREQGVGTVETRWKRKDGSIRDILLSSVPLEPDNLGKGVTFTALDITERKRAEEYRASLARIFDESLNEIYIFNADTLKFNLINQAAQRNLDYSMEELRQLTPLDLKPEFTLESFLDMIEPLRNGEKQKLQFETVHRRKDASLYPVEVHLQTAVFDESPAFVANIIDITERKQAENEIRHRAGELAALLKSSQSLAATLNLEIVLQTTTDSITELMELQSAAIYLLEGETLYLGATSPALPPQFSEEFRRASLADHPHIREAITTGLPVFLPDTATVDLTPAERAVSDARGLRSILYLPLLVEAKVIGTLIVASVGEPRVISEAGIEVCITLANLAALAVENAHLFESVQHHAANLEQQVAERKQAENDLRVALTKYKTLFNAVPLGITVSDESGAIIESNVMAEKLLGLSQNEQAQRAIDGSEWRIVRPDGTLMPVDEYASVRALKEKRLVENVEMGIVKSKETTTWISVTADLLPLEGYGVVIAYSDISDRKLAEDALRMKTEELETLFSISKHLRAARSADDMLPLVIREMGNVLGADAGAIILLDPDGWHFRYAFADGALEANMGKKFAAEKSISGLILQTGKPYVTEDLSSDPAKAANLLGFEELGPAVVVPLLSEENFLGVLICARARKEPSLMFSASEVQLLTAVGEMVGNALRRARLYDQALMRLQNVQALHSIDMAISANMNLSVVLDVLLTQGSAQLNVDAASVLLLNPNTHTLEYEAGYGFRTKAIESIQLGISEGLPGQVVLNRELLFVPDLLKSDRLLRKKLLDEGFVSYRAAPLIAKGQLQGVLELFSRTPMMMNKEQTGFLETLATQAAIAIDNAQLFNDLQRSKFELEIAYNATIEGWSRALELRDQETEGHTLRVAKMTERLAQAMGIEGKEMIQIRRGALLHDIGKMGVPDRILLKPGKLDDDEWNIMKQHAEYAFEMLWPIEFLRPAIDIPHCHHERWDGTGYPRGFKGEQIPLSARIFAVVDVWDALNSDRPYRKAWPEQKALDFISSNSGKLFDPHVVATFLELLKDFGRDHHGQ